MIFTPTPENPENTPDHLKAALTAAIAKFVRENYPTDKYRSRKLDFETLTQLLITMDGGSIAKELLSAELDVSASAFVQRRKRFEWRHFERILEEFNEMCEDSATFKGYRVFAVDGTSVNLARDPKADTFMVNDSAPKSRRGRPTRIRRKAGFSYRRTRIPTANTAAIPAPDGGIFRVHTRSAFALSGFS